ncbi:unnamed protein product [Blepharisma stoltei]|uniref:Rotatin n=1 Tax=Blepharisma stoltei TaxID=1481888 RepID=A0AAU9IC17_9CILI|nr:unnamed protein product [Blepharisma stoltei]
MEEIIKKIARFDHPEISDRAILTVCSKLSNRVARIDDFIEIEKCVISGLIMSWINIRQEEAEIQTINAALKVLQLLALNPKGHFSLMSLGAIDFFNAYYKNAPTTLQSLVSGILNALVSPAFAPIPISQPSQIPDIDEKLQIFPANELPNVTRPKNPPKKENYTKDPEQLGTILEHCEFPPVLLCDSDEKVIFDLGVLVKFGNVEEMIESCNDFQYSILQNYPLDSLMQRPDLIRSIISLASIALQKGALEVTYKALKSMEAILIKLEHFTTQASKAEYRAATCTPKKVLLPLEHIEISVPCLKGEQWGVGTPGLTLSSLSLAELIINGIPLEDSRIIGVAIKSWEAGLWTMPKLLKYPKVVNNILEKIGNALQQHSEKPNSNENSIIIKSILELGLKFIFMLPPDRISECLSKQSNLSKFIADLIVFQGENCDEILPYLEEIDKDAVKEFEYAKKCMEAIEASIKIKQLLAHQKTLPITSPEMFYNAIIFFERVMPVLEFQQDLPIQNPILDLNVYSQLLSQDSTLDSRSQQCQNLLLALLASPIETVKQNTFKAVKAAVIEDIAMTGIGEGVIRSKAIKSLLLQEPILGFLIISCTEIHDVIPRVLETLEDYNKLVPYFTILQGLSAINPNLGGIIHTLTNQQPASQPLRFIRDLFSQNSSNRILAAQILKSCHTPENIQESWISNQRDFWDSPETLDLVPELESHGELDLLQLPKNNNVSSAEMMNLLNILKSESLETNLKVAAAEQVLIHLLCGTNEVQLLEDFIVNAIQELRVPDEEDRAGIRLVSNSLQILVVIALNYPQQARKIYQSSVKFMCTIVPLIYNPYRPIRYYSLYLLYILAFSNQIQRNSFILSTLFVLVPQSVEHSKLKPIQVIDVIKNTFLCPFPIQVLKVTNSTLCKFLDFWEMVPSSERVHNYVFNRKVYKFDVEDKLDEYGNELNQAETHADILRTMLSWENLVLATKSVSFNAYKSLLKPDSLFFSQISSILRVPPTSRPEDLLYIHLLESFRTVLAYANPSTSQQEFEFIQNLCLLLQRSMLPFLSELTDLHSREALISSILRFSEKLLIHHGSTCPNVEGIIKVLSRFQIEPGKASLLSLLERILQAIDNLKLYGEVISVLILVMDNDNLKLSMDIIASPQSQYNITSIINLVLTKLIPFTSPSTFVHKNTLKKALQLCIRIPEWVQPESYIWCMKLAEDREISIRILAWCFLWKKSRIAYEKHSSVLDTALDVIFAQAESYGVKTQACAFLCSLTESLINSEDSAEMTDTVLKTLYQYGVISNVKNVLFENSGPHPAYFGSIVTLLYNITLLDYSRVSPILIQIDIWDPLIRLIRPGALLERLFNEQRKPCKDYQSYSFEDTLIGLVSILNFIAHMMKQDAQITDYLLESTHILTYVLDWIQECLESFEESKELLYGKTLQSLLSCLHISIFQSPVKSKQSIENFRYELLCDIFDISRGSELKLTISRLLTCLLPHFPIDAKEADRLVLHLIHIYKENQHEDQLAAARDTENALASLLFYSESAKNVAIATGFAKDLYGLAKVVSNEIQAQDSQKNKKQDDFSLKVLTRFLTLFKLWSANSQSAKASLSGKEKKSGPLLQLLFNLWPLALRKESLFTLLLETICTLISESEVSKEACTYTQENRQCLLLYVIEYLSRPSTASDFNFRLALKMLGSLCASTSTRQLLIKTKYPQGLCQRLVKVWNDCKDPQAIPIKSPSMIEFLAAFAFYDEGQKVIATIPGLIDVLVEVLERFSTTGIKYEVVENSLLLLRNLCFSANNKPHILANQRSLMLLLTFTSSNKQKPKLRNLASSALWALLYNNQKVKGLLRQDEILRQLEVVQSDTSRSVDELTSKEDNGDDLENLKQVAENINSVLKICIDP